MAHAKEHIVALQKSPHFEHPKSPPSLGQQPKMPNFAPPSPPTRDERRTSSSHHTSRDWPDTPADNYSQGEHYHLPDPHQQFPHYAPKPALQKPALLPFYDLSNVPPPTRPAPGHFDQCVIPPSPMETPVMPFSNPEPVAPGTHKLRKATKPGNGALKPMPKSLNNSPSGSAANSPPFLGRLRTESGSMLALPSYADLAPPGTGPPTMSGDSSSPPRGGGSPSQEQKANRRRSWLPGSRSRGPSESRPNGPGAWIITPEGRGNAYDVGALNRGDTVPELWDDRGDVLVYLPVSTDPNPSFRIPSSVIASSPQLLQLAFGQSGRKHSFSPVLTEMHAYDDDSSPLSLSSNYSRPSGEQKLGHLYFPKRIEDSKLSQTQAEQENEAYLISVRNLFAFLMCQPLVGSKRHPTGYATFNMIAAHLTRLGFTNIDGSTFGDEATTSFSFFLEGYQIADVRKSREKTIEALIIGERMKSSQLYNEAFAHAVGKYTELVALKSDLFPKVSANTRNRIERAWIDLSQRKQAVEIRLENFDFPALFSGIASSNTADEARMVRYKSWKTHFLIMRKHILAYYKDQWGSWPPRASSKKNHFTVSGLNRLVLRTLYFDLCTLYDLIVDRTNLTTRTMDSSASSSEQDTPIHEALRKLLEESDNSSPPVQPPMPFDVPLVPTMSTLEPNFPRLADKKQQAANTRKLKSHETPLLLARSHNLDSRLNTPFLKWFLDLEEHEARGRNCSELAEMRVGMFLFVYVVLQSLPMVVVDAPKLSFHSGVETFLCSPAKGLAPWMDESGTMAIKRNWYGVAGGQGMVALPSDVVEYGVEGIYRGSHCWIMAEKWLAGSEGQGDRDVEQYAMSPLETPIMPFSHGRTDSGSGADSDGGSDSGRQDWRGSQWRPMAGERGFSRNRLSMGLEQLSLPDEFGSSHVQSPPLTSDDPSTPNYFNPASQPQSESSSAYHLDGLSSHPQTRPQLGLPTSKSTSDLSVRQPHRLSLTPPQAQPRSAHRSTSSQQLSTPSTTQGTYVRDHSRASSLVGAGEDALPPPPRAENVKEAKGFDDILKDMGREDGKDAKKRRKEEEKRAKEAKKAGRK